MSGTSSHIAPTDVRDLPSAVNWVDRWALRIGAGVFAVGVLCRVIQGPGRKAISEAIVYALMGLLSYYGLRLIIRFQAVIRNTIVTGALVRSFLTFFLIMMGLFCAQLTIALVLWPKQYGPELVAIAMPTGVALSAVRLWKESFTWPGIPKHVQNDEAG